MRPCLGARALLDRACQRGEATAGWRKATVAAGRPDRRLDQKRTAPSNCSRQRHCTACKCNAALLCFFTVTSSGGTYCVGQAARALCLSSRGWHGTGTGTGTGTAYPVHVHVQRFSAGHERFTAPAPCQVTAYYVKYLRYGCQVTALRYNASIVYAAGGRAAALR